jgi:hypothetical protein
VNDKGKESRIRKSQLLLSSTCPTPRAGKLLAWKRLRFDGRGLTVRQRRDGGSFDGQEASIASTIGIVERWEKLSGLSG